ncbi:MAG TPA: ribbon-helix-helix protein, CopG family [Flavobacteriaceae bacterium]|nr:ribbon-helix-helix protein, CopG family [Flavobacteriaceae bacterium]
MSKDNKETTLTIRIEHNLKDTFKKVAKANDDDISKVLRRYIRQYIKENSQKGIGGLQ